MQIHIKLPCIKCERKRVFNDPYSRIFYAVTKSMIKIKENNIFIISSEIISNKFELRGTHEIGWFGIPLISVS